MAMPQLVSKRLLAAALVATTAGLLQGCIEAALLGGAAATAAVVTDRRPPEVVLGDERIEVMTSNRREELLRDKGQVTSVSYNYAVLLTGQVPSDETKAQLEKLVSQIPLVKSVVNELQVAGGTSLSARSNDTYITGKVKANFVAQRKFHPNHVKVVTESGVVYLMGLVTRDEADAATEIARSTSGVLKVVRIFEYVVPVKR
jgi:osmotically-inducible protein OsmY